MLNVNQCSAASVRSAASAHTRRTKSALMWSFRPAGRQPLISDDCASLIVPVIYCSCSCCAHCWVRNLPLSPTPVLGAFQQPTGLQSALITAIFSYHEHFTIALSLLFFTMKRFVLTLTFTCRWSEALNLSCRMNRVQERLYVSSLLLCLGLYRTHESVRVMLSKRLWCSSLWW